MQSVTFSPDGSRLARVEGRLVVVCDARTGFVESTLTGHSARYVFFSIFFVSLFLLIRVLTSHNYRVLSVAWSKDGKLASSSCDETVKIWSVGSTGTFECESTLTGHLGRE